MNLIIILVLQFLNLSIGDKIVTVKGQLYRYTYLSIYDYDSCVYIDSHEFNDTNIIDLKITVKYGNLSENKMYRGGSDQKFGYNAEVKMPDSYIYYNSYKLVNDGNEKKNVFHFHMPKSIYRYLYVSIPSFYPLYSSIVISSSYKDDEDEDITEQSSANHSFLDIFGSYAVFGLGFSIIAFIFIIVFGIYSLIKHRNSKNNSDKEKSQNELISKVG